ncbi:CpaF family protein [Candidatus Woesearchaeota archaeon]|nr:CpaF family protein [Candidatus Woesearchaeota archaeon]
MGIIEENGTYVYKVQIDFDHGNPLDELMKDEDIEEIMYNGPKVPIKIIHNRMHMISTNVYLNDSQAQKFALDVATTNKKFLGEKSPTMDGVLFDGSRINVTIPPATPTITFTIRKFSRKVITIVDMINEGVVDCYTGAFLWSVVEGLGHLSTNILVVGGTASGKTTFLNALSVLIPQTERVITIEDTAELRILQNNKVPMFSGKNASMDSLLQNALRMRPDRIIVGEVRGVEARTLFNAMNTGHNGCMGTLHARNARETLTRVTNEPLSVPVNMVRDLDLIIVLEKINQNGREKRIISEITEIEVMAGDQVSFNQIYAYDAKAGRTIKTKIPSRLRAKIAKAAGIEIKKFDIIVEDRSNILELVAKKQKETNNGLNTSVLFDIFERNRNHWQKYKGKKKFGMFKRKEEELIDWN